MKISITMTEIVTKSIEINTKDFDINTKNKTDEIFETAELINGIKNDPQFFFDRQLDCEISTHKEVNNIDLNPIKQ